MSLLKNNKNSCKKFILRKTSKLENKVLLKERKKGGGAEREKEREREKGRKKGRKKERGASLVAQWLRICLLMQGTRVRALVWEDPTCHGAAGPVSHNC